MFLRYIADVFSEPRRRFDFIAFLVLVLPSELLYLLSVSVLGVDCKRVGMRFETGGNWLVMARNILGEGGILEGVGIKIFVTGGRAIVY